MIKKFGLMNSLSRLYLGLPWWLSGKESSYQGRGHGFYPWSGRIPHALEQLSPVPQQLSLCSRAWGLQLLKPECPRARGPQEKPLQWEAHASQLESSPGSPQLEKSPCTATKTQHSQTQINTLFLKYFLKVTQRDREGIRHLNCMVRKTFLTKWPLICAMI